MNVSLQDEGKRSLDYLVDKLPSLDQSTLPLVLEEVRGLGQVHPALLGEYVDQISRLYATSSSTVRLVIQQIKDDVRKK